MFVVEMMTMMMELTWKTDAPVLADNQKPRHANWQQKPRKMIYKQQTSSCDRSVACLTDLSSRILDSRGNRMEIPPAVWTFDLQNSAPIISQTWDF